MISINCSIKMDCCECCQLIPICALFRSKLYSLVSRHAALAWRYSAISIGGEPMGSSERTWFERLYFLCHMPNTDSSSTVGYQYSAVQKDHWQNQTSESAIYDQKRLFTNEVFSWYLQLLYFIFDFISTAFDGSTMTSEDLARLWHSRKRSANSD